MSGFRLGFGVASVRFGPSARGPVEVLADLGGAIDFNTKKEHFSLRAGVPKNMVPLRLVGLLKLLKPFGGSWRLLGAS